MTQGSGRTVHEPKMEPDPRKVNVDAVSVIGQAVAYVRPNLEDGRGYSAPKNASETSHKGGSQGRH